ncbi:hypothetical protein ABFS82_11G009000 [Erythranthe guttata]|nr:PREDICTED: pectinesterase inhibitor 2-like [Erythranthe guttata]|eukprot:XP_012857191.1 PREDICTED: pectinesterase inhibitor 2-like [Erythranthe guttata]
MASSSTLSQLIIFLIILFSTNLLFAIPATSYPIENICRQTKNPDSCYKLLTPHANANLQEIGRIVIETTSAKFTLTGALIESYRTQTKDPNLKTVYTLCVNYYRSALVEINGARDKLKTGQFGGVNAAANTVSRDSSACIGTFATNAPNKSIPIAKETSDVDYISSVFVVVSRILSSGAVV